MNIFFLDTNPILAAQYQCDKHVVKMILETAQMLCTNHRVLDGTRLVSEKTKKPLQQYDHPTLNDTLYKCAHNNHPSTKWIRRTSANYLWAYEHFIALCDEYTYRYGKVHLTDSKLREVLKVLPTNIPIGGLILEDTAAIAINEEIDKLWDCKSATNIVDTYQRYYLYKSTVVSPFVFTSRAVPKFLLDYGFDIGAIFEPEEAPWKLDL